MKSEFRKRLRAIGVVCGGACLIAPLLAWSQAWPAKPIRVLVPFLPGATDVTIRLLIPKMQEQLGQPLFIENRAGANGRIGARLVAESAPDGYTLLYTNAGPIAFAPATQKNLSYDPVLDFTPIMAVSEGVEVLVANSTLPVRSVKELIEHARANPGKLFYASSGQGGAQHVAGEMFNRLAGTDITAVHYVSFAQIVPALVSGQVALAYLTLQAAKPLVASGKLKLIATKEPRRLETLPELETIAESLPGYEKLPGWLGLLGPARLPQSIVERLHSAALNALKTPEMAKRFADAYGPDGIRIIGNTPREFAAGLKQGVEMTIRTVKDLGINVSE